MIRPTGFERSWLSRRAAESAAGWAEKAYAGERSQLTQQLLARLVECEAGLG